MSDDSDDSERDNALQAGYDDDLSEGSDGHTFSSAGSGGSSDEADHKEERVDADAAAQGGRKKFAHKLEQWSWVRRFLFRVVESKWFSGFILTVIMMNTILITLQTIDDLNRRYAWYMNLIDNMFLGIYIYELLLKLFVLRSRFFYSGWNNFDLLIVMSSAVDFSQYFVRNFVSINPKILRTFRLFRALRAIRALRVLRTIAFLKNLQVIVNTLLTSIPAMGSIVLLLALILYIFAIIGRDMFHEAAPDRFGSLGWTIFSLFQLMTLDDWFMFYDDVRDTKPEIVWYLIVFIVLETFIFINLFTAVIVNNLQASEKIATHSHRRRENKQAMLKMNEQVRAKQEYARQRMRKMLSRQHGDISAFYRGQNLDPKQKQLMAGYFMLLASLENNNSIYQYQQQRIDQLVDMSKADETRGAFGGLL